MLSLLEPKQTIMATAQKFLPEAADAAQQIYDWHELSGQEHRSAALLCAKLKSAGAIVETGVAGMATAFCATFGAGKPIIALLAEYDALPEMGHACGHNLSGAASTYAAIALEKSGALKNIPGSLVVLGCPEEEAGGGKIKLLNAGIFKPVDAALMTHTGSETRAGYRTVASQGFIITLYQNNAPKMYHRRKLNLMDMLTEVLVTLRIVKNSSGVGTSILWSVPVGGTKHNVTPPQLVVDVGIWSYDEKVMLRTKQRIEQRLKKIIQHTPFRVEFKLAEPPYLPFAPNETLENTFEKNLTLMVAPFEPRRGLLNDSIDTGNVSQVIPTLHADVLVDNSSTHTPEHAVACARGQASEIYLQTAMTGLALTAFDLLASPDRLKQAKAVFAREHT